MAVRWRTWGWTGPLVVAAAAATAVPGASAQPRSGLRGQVLYGPTCPVQRPGQRCQRPDPATIVVRRARGRPVVTVTTPADGRFAVSLAPGRYLLTVTARAGRPATRSLPVVVRPGQTTPVTVRFDSGIRSRRPRAAAGRAE